jgi:hypothetical protein
MKATETQNHTTPAEGFKLRGLRWYIVGLVFLATLINYIDRLTLSVLAPLITKDFGFIKHRIRRHHDLVSARLHDQPGAVGQTLRPDRN